MSIVSGAFSETLLQDLYKRASEVALDGRINLQFIPRIDALKSLAAIQGGKILTGVPLLKNQDVVLWWDNFCEIVADDNTGCEYPSTKGSTNAEPYTIAWEKMSGFSLDEEDFDNNLADQATHYAKMMLTAEKVLLEAFTQYCIAQINSFKGVNVVSTGLGTVSGADTYIAPGSFNAAAIPYITRVAVLNQLTNPILLSGNNLWESYYKAKFDASDKSDVNLYQQLNLQFDLFNLDTVLSPLFYSFLISNGSIALLNKNYNKPTLEVSQEGERWSQTSILFPQFTFDVFRKTVCKEGSNDRWVTNVKLKLKADIVLNPTGCSSTNTGILSLICGSAGA